MRACALGSPTMSGSPCSARIAGAKPDINGQSSLATSAHSRTACFACSHQRASLQAPSSMLTNVQHNSASCHRHESLNANSTSFQHLCDASPISKRTVRLCINQWAADQPSEPWSMAMVATPHSSGAGRSVDRSASLQKSHETPHATSNSCEVAHSHFFAFMRWTFLAFTKSWRSSFSPWRSQKLDASRCHSLWIALKLSFTSKSCDALELYPGIALTETGPGAKLFSERK